MDTVSTHDDGPVTVSFHGRDFTALGAYIGPDGGCAYIADMCARRAYSPGNVTACGGEVLGTYEVTGFWQGPFRDVSGLPTRMASVRATIAGRVYVGKFGYEWSQLIRLRPAKGG